MIAPRTYLAFYYDCVEVQRFHRALRPRQEARGSPRAALLGFHSVWFLHVVLNLSAGPAARRVLAEIFSTPEGPNGLGAWEALGELCNAVF